jgi:hypothetical protein
MSFIDEDKVAYFIYPDKLVGNGNISVSKRGNTVNLTVPEFPVSDIVSGGNGIVVTDNGSVVTLNDTGVRSIQTDSNGVAVTNGPGVGSVSTIPLVKSVAVGAGLSSTGSVGNVSLANTGVLSVAGGTGISVSGGTGDVTISATGGGVNSIVAGAGIITSGSGAVTVTNDGVRTVTATATSTPFTAIVTGNDLAFAWRTIGTIALSTSNVGWASGAATGISGTIYYHAIGGRTLVWLNVTGNTRQAAADVLIITGATFGVSKYVVMSSNFFVNAAIASRVQQVTTASSQLLIDVVPGAVTTFACTATGLVQG